MSNSGDVLLLRINVAYRRELCSIHRNSDVTRGICLVFFQVEVLHVLLPEPR